MKTIDSLINKFKEKWGEGYRKNIFTIIPSIKNELLIDFEKIAQSAYDLGKSEQPESTWQKEKPDYPCAFLTRNKNNEEWEYSLWYFEWVDFSDEEHYLGWFDADHEEYDDISEIVADEYFIVEKIEPISDKQRSDKN